MLGLYDSGIGGFTIWQAIHNRYPNLKIRYFADLKNCPLGEKASSEITKVVKEGVTFLFNKGCDIVILACNTATANSIRYLQSTWLPSTFPDKKILGIAKPTTEFVIEDGIRPTDQILIMATPATIHSGFYQSELHQLGFTSIIDCPCPGLAAAIEYGDKDINQLVARITKPKVTKELRAVILACTHYPLVKSTILETLVEFGVSPSIHIIEQSQTVADKFAEYLNKHQEFPQETGPLEVWVYGDTITLQDHVSRMFQLPLNTQFRTV